ncbi:MAG: vWA domain-containing protein [Polyangiales bacterium]
MRGLVGALLAASCACGARSALELPTREPDGGAIDRPAADVDPDVPCANGPIPLRRRASVALLAIDRSGSMDLDLLGGNGVPRRWDVMRAVLPDALAALDPDVSLGALLFPPVGAAECAAPQALDLGFGEARAEPVARVLDAARPSGRTPTYATLVQAERQLQGATRDGARVVVLATDGGPNCNAALDGDRCGCATGARVPGQDECRADPSLCLDDQRAVAQASAMAARGVLTFVIGIDGDRRPALVDALTRLARAGGRPNPRSPRAYYSVQRPEDLREAVDAIGRTLSACTLLAAARPPADATLSLRVRGALAPRDPSRVEGWDWLTPDGAELALYGSACDAAGGGAEVTLTASCGDR